MVGGRGDRREGARLGPLQRDIMEALWDGGRMTVRHIEQQLNASRTPRLAYTTIQTVVLRLVRLGLAARHPDHGADLFSPTVERGAFLESQARLEVERWLESYGDIGIGTFFGAIAQDERRLALVERLVVEARSRLRPQ
ncbi:MAG TPA: BlaI/MecI/CopY family transcriptional regulator [Actinomycetota bacterium]|nr:BlaI/MecI/CopY family transcriptional regulator [Actinomycetota bacterium]